MTRKAAKPFRMAPLQTLAVKPIKDPAEQAALDERLKRSQEAVGSDAGRDRVRNKPTAPLVLELCRHLSAAARFQVATELLAQLPPEQRTTLLVRLRGRPGDQGKDGNSAAGKKRQ